MSAHVDPNVPGKAIVFTGRCKGMENAMEMATVALGPVFMQEHGPDGHRRWKFAGVPSRWLRFEWTSSYDEAHCEGLPTVSLPQTFSFYYLNPDPFDAK